MNGKYTKNIKDNTVTSQSRGFFYYVYETVIGVLFYAFCILVLVFLYVLIFGYGLGTIIFYAFNATLMMPVSQHECFVIGLIPIINILAGFAALWVLMWTLIITVAWKAFIWLLSVLPGFLDAWAKNIQR